MTNLTTIGDRLKHFRDNIVRFKQREMADLLGISQRTYTRYESNEASIPAENLKKLLKKFNLNLNWLISGKGEIFAGEPYTEVKYHPDVISNQTTVSEKLEKLKRDNNLTTEEIASAILRIVGDLLANDKKE